MVPVRDTFPPGRAEAGVKDVTVGSGPPTWNLGSLAGDRNLAVTLLLALLDRESRHGATFTVPHLVSAFGIVAPLPRKQTFTPVRLGWLVRVWVTVKTPVGLNPLGVSLVIGAG